MLLLSLANGWLTVVAGDIMEDNAIIVEIVENTQADLITFPVVRLGTVGTRTIFLIKIIISMEQLTPQYLTS